MLIKLYKLSCRKIMFEMINGANNSYLAQKFKDGI